MRGQGVTQAPASSSPPPQPYPHPPGSSSLADGCNLDNMHACSPFQNSAVLPTGAAHSTHPTDRRPPLKVPHPSEVLKCPRCDSLDTKFCYYNNYSLTQPRYFCKNCKRYWTAGGALRNVPVGGGLRKNKRSKLKLAAEAEAAVASAQALSTAAVLAATGAGQHHYQGQALAAHATSRSAAELTSQKVENRAVAPVGPAAVLPSGNIYAQYSGAPALNYDTSSDEMERNGDAVSAQHEQTGNSSYREGDDQQALTGRFYSGLPSTRPHATHFYTGYGGSMPNGGHDGHEFCNEGGDYMVNCNFLEEVTNPNNGEEAMSTSGGEMRGGEVEKDDGGGAANCSYDSWQLLSEGLNIFNGGADGHGSLFYNNNMASTVSWPDFSQFNNGSTGPG